MARTRTLFRPQVFPGRRKVWTGSGYFTPIPDGSAPLTTQIDSVSGVSGQDTCVDTIMSPPYNVDHDLLITHKHCSPTRLYGRANAYPTINTHTEFFGEIWAFGNTSECPSAYSPNDAFLKTKALSNMNPNKPVVSILPFLAEFRDIPNLVRNLGRLMIRKGSKSKKIRDSRPSDIPDAWLSWSFGWQPLINDAMALFDMTARIEERKSYLRNLANGAYIRRKLQNESFELPPLDFTILNGSVSGQPAIKAVYRRKTRVRSWFTANAVIQIPLPAEDLAMQKLATQMAYPLSATPDDLWELLPWSWLADYFVNIGDVLDAQRGGIPWKCTRMCVMTEAWSRNEISQYYKTKNTTASCNLNGYAETHTLKRKVYSNPTPSIGFAPLLSDGEIANISALSSSKFLKLGRL